MGLVELTIEEEIEFIKTRVNAKRNDDGLDGSKRRQWAIVHTELEKLLAYVKVYLSEEDESE